VTVPQTGLEKRFRHGAASFAEANQRFKRNVLGEVNGDLPALEYAESEEPARIGRKKAAAK
jgi:hypothetical protein